MSQLKAKTTIMRARMAGLIGPKRAKFLNVMILRSDPSGREMTDRTIVGLEVGLQQLSQRFGE